MISLLIINVSSCTVFFLIIRNDFVLYNEKRFFMMYNEKKVNERKFELNFLLQQCLTNNNKENLTNSYSISLKNWTELFLAWSSIHNSQVAHANLLYKFNIFSKDQWK